jgi:hypothetical protein
VGVDVSRVFLNSALLEINDRQAEALSGSRGRRSEHRRFVPGIHFIVNSAGIDTYDELANAKSVLYQRVYLHQLTRNAEQVLARALRAAMEDSPNTQGWGESIRRAWRYLKKPTKAPSNDVLSWFRYGDDELLERLAGDPTSRDMALRLISRDLPKRAFVLFRDVCEPFVGLHDLFDASEWSGDSGAGGLDDMQSLYARRTAWRLFDQLMPLDPIERPRRIEELRTAVRRNAIDARRALDPQFRAGTLRADDPYVGISPRMVLKPISEVLVREKNSIGHSGQWTKSEELTAADNIGRGVDYVHADHDWRRYVTIACVKALYDLHADRRTEYVTDSAAPRTAYDTTPNAVRPRLHARLEDICSRVGIDYDTLVTDMTRAARVGYFGNAERVVPLDQAQARLCADVAQHYASFLGERGWHVTENSVTAFTRQFPVDLRRELLEVLPRGEFLGRGATRNAMDQISSGLERRFGSPLIFCRFSPNSGSFTGMILEQERREEYQRAGHVFVRSLAELEQKLAEMSPACVVFVDDQFATGGQAHAQLLQWSGKPRDQWPAELRGEQNIEIVTLGQRTSEAFTDGRVALAFIFGTVGGKERIEHAAKKLGYQNLEVLLNSEINPQPIQMSPDLKGFLEGVGYEVLKRARYNPADEIGSAMLTEEQEARLRQDALGYGGTASIIVTPFNAPSHTVTALWCPGLYQEQPWIPLFLRRGYRKFLVLG